jgi:predicted DNA-binding transcriptional regulator AlpA
LNFSAQPVLTLENNTVPSLLDDLLTVKQLLDRLQVCKQTVFNWIRDRGFPQPVKIGHMRYWKSSEVTAYLEGQLGGRGGHDAA